jgi:hypothetical protein
MAYLSISSHEDTEIVIRCLELFHHYYLVLFLLSSSLSVPSETLQDCMFILNAIHYTFKRLVCNFMFWYSESAVDISNCELRLLHFPSM